MWLLSRVNSDPDGILVCINQQEIHRLMQEHPEISIGKFVTYREAISEGKLRGLRPTPNLYIDNLDLMLEDIFGAPVKSVSFSLGVDR